MWGRGVKVDDVPSAKLSTRLASHACGRRSGDQFCLYIADRLVLPTLSAQRIRDISAGALQFDALVREYIRELLAYRFIAAEDGKQALEIEAAVKGGALGERPSLNPSAPRPTCMSPMMRSASSS